MALHSLRWTSLGGHNSALQTQLFKNASSLRKLRLSDTAWCPRQLDLGDPATKLFLRPRIIGRPTVGSVPESFFWDPRLVPRALLCSGMQGQVLDSCRVGNPRTFYRLVEQGADLNAVDKDGNTCLHLACKGGHRSLVRELVGRGADPYARNARGQTPLDLANARHDNMANVLNLAYEISKPTAREPPRQGEDDQEKRLTASEGQPPPRDQSHRENRDREKPSTESDEPPPPYQPRQDNGGQRVEGKESEPTPDSPIAFTVDSTRASAGATASEEPPPPYETYQPEPPPPYEASRSVPSPGTTTAPMPSRAGDARADEPTTSVLPPEVQRQLRELQERLGDHAPTLARRARTDEGAAAKKRELQQMLATGGPSLKLYHEQVVQALHALYMAEWP